MADQKESPVERCNADGAVNAETIQGNHTMTDSITTPAAEPNYIKKGYTSMFSESVHKATVRDHGAICPHPFVRFIDKTADIASGVEVILLLATNADVESSGHA